jgi:hypothetical protein
MYTCRLLVLTSILLSFSIIGKTQPPADTSRPALTLSGAVDVFYRYDLARSRANGFTSFTQSHNEFNLGMANLKLEHKTSRVDMVADLAFGPREKTYAYNDSGITQAIKQLYISYSPRPWLKFSAGTWATHLCYESPDATANRNYSMSYLFSNDPFSHTGIKAELTLGRHGFMLGIANPSDYRSIPPDGYNNKNILAQYTYSFNDNTKLSLNYVGGRDVRDDRSHQLDLVFTAKPGKWLGLGFNGTINQSSLAAEEYATLRRWWGAVLYCNLDPKPWLGFTLRTGYFDDVDGVKLPLHAHIVATTLSANLRIDGFTLIPELRIDNASSPIFFHADGSPAHTAANFLIAAVYAF